MANAILTAIFVAQVGALTGLVASFAVVWSLGLIGIMKSRLKNPVNAPPYTGRSLQQINANLQTNVGYLGTKAGRVFTLALTSLVTCGLVLAIAVGAEFLWIAKTGLAPMGAAR